MTVYTIASGKGGVGKTTFALNTGAALSELGLRTLVIDCDIGMANLGLLINIESTKIASLHEVLAGKVENVSEAINKTSYGLDVLLSGISIGGFTQADPEKLRDVVGKLVDEYEFILLDAPAGISKESMVPLAVSDEVILITNPELPSVTDTLKTKLMMGIVDRKIRGTVVNRVMGTKGELAASKIEDLLEVEVLGAIPEDITVTKAVAFKVPVVVRMPGSPAAKRIKAIARKLAKLEASEDSEKYGFVERLLEAFRRITKS
jgi:septum site-determining protein MinD